MRAICRTLNNRNTRKRCGICLKLRIKTPEDDNDVVLVFLLLIETLEKSVKYVQSYTNTYRQRREKTGEIKEVLIL